MAFFVRKVVKASLYFSSNFIKFHVKLRKIEGFLEFSSWDLSKWGVEIRAKLGYDSP